MDTKPSILCFTQPLEETSTEHNRKRRFALNVQIRLISVQWALTNDYFLSLIMHLVSRFANSCYIICELFLSMLLSSQDMFVCSRDSIVRT